MLWCTELDTAENFGLTSIQKPLIAISKCPLLNIHPVWYQWFLFIGVRVFFRVLEEKYQFSYFKAKE